MWLRTNGEGLTKGTQVFQQFQVNDEKHSYSLNTGELLIGAATLITAFIIKVYAKDSPQPHT